MSTSRDFHALPSSPAGAGLLALARTNPAVAEDLALFELILRRAKKRVPAGGAGEIAARPYVSMLLHDDPSLVGRAFSIDKRWDVMRYLLVASRRDGAVELPPTPRDRALDLALLGDDPLLPESWELSDGRRFAAHRLRHTSAEGVKIAATAIEGVSVDELRASYDVEKMGAAHVNGAPASANAEQAWTTIVELFTGLQAFYRDAAARGDGVLVSSV